MMFTHYDCHICKRFIIALGIMFLLAACQTQESKTGDKSASQFSLSDLGKSDVDMVGEVHIRLSDEHLKVLTRKLYLRNPNQLKRSSFNSIDEAIATLFDANRTSTLEELSDKRASEAIYLAFHEDFAGDRIAAFIEGMRTMLIDAYGGKAELFVTDEIDAQKVYYLARNYEIAFWKLTHDSDANGQLYLLSNATSGGVVNISFERLFGKLISLQDAMAQVLADTNNRRLKNVIQGVASMIFFPI